MASKEELIAGVKTLIQEGKRIGDAFTDDQWATVVDLDGWKNREVLAHVAGIASIVVPFATAMMAAPSGADAGGGTDINALNAQLVSQRKDKKISELVSEIESSYSKVIEWLPSVSGESLQKRVTVRGYKDVPAGDLLMRMVVLHGLAHIYSAYAAVFAAADAATPAPVAS